MNELSPWSSIAVYMYRYISVCMYISDQFIYGYGFFGDNNYCPNNDILDGWMHQTEKEREKESFTRGSKWHLQLQDHSEYRWRFWTAEDSKLEC